MKIISCEECGVLLNTDRIPEPECYDDDGERIEENCRYNQEEIEDTAVIKCPVCASIIFYSSGTAAY